jgi:hypothetical protein
VSANPPLPTLDSRLVKMEDSLGKLANQMFALGLRANTINEQLASIMVAQEEAAQAELLLAQESVLKIDNPLPSYFPALVGPTTQTVGSVTGTYVKLDHIVFYNASIAWTTVPSGGSGWSLTCPGNLYSRSGTYSPTTWGYLYNSSVGLTSEFRGQIIPGQNVIGTLTQGWGNPPGQWVGGGLSGSGSNLTFQGWYFC